jgi:hypothetical protein
VMHWDGAQWAAVRVPRFPGRDVTMTGIVAVSPTDVWAVGHGCSGGRGCGGSPAIRPVVLHYDGTCWDSVRPARLHAADSSLQGIAGTRPGDLSAAGWRAPTRHASSRPLLERRTARRWRVEAAPQGSGILFAVGGSAGAPRWAVGDRRTPNGSRTLTARRTAAGWRAVGSPSPAGRMSYLSSVAVIGRGNVWATGVSVSGGFLLHWNGTRWSLVHPG